MTNLSEKIIARASDSTVPIFICRHPLSATPAGGIEDAAARGEDTELPKVTAGETITLAEIESEEKWTETQRYTEAGLVKELEKRLHRPAVDLYLDHPDHPDPWLCREGWPYPYRDRNRRSRRRFSFTSFHRNSLRRFHRPNMEGPAR